MNDPIVEEIRKYREQYAAKFNYDLAAICKDLRERQATCGRQVVSRPPKRVSEQEHINAESDHLFWDAWSTFRQRLALKLSDVLAEPKKAVNWPSNVNPTNIPESGRVLVEKPAGYRELLSELRRYLLTGVVVGTCKYCPQQIAAPDLPV